MHMKFNYPDKVRADFLHDVVKQLVRQRHKLALTQDDVNHMLGVADRLVSHWECGIRSPTAFHLYCWADALQSKLAIIPKESEVVALANQFEKQLANDNCLKPKSVANDNVLIVSNKKIEAKL